jgi:hypothetical protein
MDTLKYGKGGTPVRLPDRPSDDFLPARLFRSAHGATKRRTIAGLVTPLQSRKPERKASVHNRESGS